MDAGTIAGICSGVTALAGAIATFIYKVRGRSWREIFKSVVEGKSDEFKEVTEVMKQQAKVIEKVILDAKDKAKKK